MLSTLWLTLDAVGSFLLGLILFTVPHIAGNFIFQRETDGVHWHLIRCVGGQFMAGALASYLLKNSNKVTHTVCYIMRIVAFILLLLLYFETRSVNPKLVNQQIMDVVKYGCFTGVFLNIIMLLGNGWPIANFLFKSLQQANNLMLENRVGNCLYQLDSIASICIGSAWLAFPKWLLHRQVNVQLDASHELCGRVMGALFVCSFCVAQYALHWPSSEDRKVAVRCRVLCCAAILSAQVWSQWQYPKDWSHGHWVGISLYSIWTGISILYLIAVEIFAKKAQGGKKKN